MIGQIKKFRHSATRRLFAMRAWFGAFAACLVAAASLVTPALLATPALAASGDRTLNLFFTHTGESAKITFRRNGHYDQAGLNKLDKFLRDWRRNESIRMDPALFDLVWQVYQDVGATGPIHVVSAYRSPQTNAMLRSRSRAVAKESRHIKGQAMDFFIPGIPIEKLREAAMRRQVGGVGYYPTSNSPFVHLDTGNVRAWPRMTRAQLKRLFPNGRTLHLPTDGIPLSQKGRLYASAQWNKCKSVPCFGSLSNTAPSGNQNGGGTGRTLLDLFFGNNNQAGSQTIRVASIGPSQRKVTSVRVAASRETPPVPQSRPALLALRDQKTPPIPAQMPKTLLVATRGNPQTQNSSPPPDNSHPLADRANRPKPKILLSRNFGTSTLLTAYAPTSKPEPNAQRALQMLIERRNSSPSTIASPLNQSQKTHPSPEPKPKPALRGSISVASLGGVPGLGVNQAVSLFDATWNAVNNARSGQQIGSGQQIDPIVTGAISPTPDISLLPIKMRPIKLVAPDLENVADAMVAPARVSGAHFAIMFEPDEGDFSPATELGPLMGQINFKLSAFSNLKTSRFTLKAPQLTTAL